MRALLAFAALSLLTRGPFVPFPLLNDDEAAHAVGSWVLSDGGRLYTDYADHKPPLLYLHYAAAQALLGRGMPAVRLFTALVTIPLTALAASAFYRHDRRGRAAGLLFIAYTAAFLAHDVQAVNGEVLMLLPAAWALVLVRDPEEAARPLRAGLAGALLGLATLFKHQAVLWLAAVALVGWAAGARRLRVTLALLAGFVLPLSAAAAWFAADGRLDDFLYWNITHNLRYAANPIGGGEALGRAARYLLPFLVVTLPLWWAAWKSAPLLEAHRRRLLAATLACSVPAVFLGLRFFPHYFIQLELPLALAAAPYAVELMRRPLTAAAKAALGWTVLAVAGFTAANLYVYARRPQAYAETSPALRHVADRLRADACHAGATLFVWGFAPGFYYHSGLPPASRFVVPAYTVSGYVPGNRSLDWADAQRLLREDHRAWLIEDLQRRRATYVLDTSPSGLHRWRDFPLHGFPQLASLVRREYALVGVVDGVAIHRRRGCDPAGQSGMLPSVP